jgi:hypothetical protein
MRDFKLFTADDRYGVPTLLLISVASAERARSFAQRELAASNHHKSVEVWEGDDLLFVFRTQTSRRRSGLSRVVRPGRPRWASCSADGHRRLS